MFDEDHNYELDGTETREEIEQVEISTSQNQANSSYNEVVLNIRVEKLLPKLGQLQKDLYPTEREREGQKIIVEIKKIPEIMKRNETFANYFTPKWTFGPIHYRHSLKHDIKLKLAALFISENGSTTENIFEFFKTNMDGIRACFGENIISDIGEEELMGLLFLDGCAILGFIHGYVNRRLKVVGIVSDVEAADIERDLFLLENQIPFRVLEVLIGSGKDQVKENLKGSLEIFFYLICRGTFPGHSPEGLKKHLDDYCFSPERNENQKAVHLLDVFREALLSIPPSFDPFGHMLTLIRGTFWILCSCGCLAICYFLNRFKQEPYDIISQIRRAKQFFQSVQELKAAGIKFKPTHSLTTVSFRSLFFFRPQLMLPTLIVDDSTASKLVNLVAYEMCLSESHPNKKPWVTSYVNLLDSLVDNEQDIKDLRTAGILRNTLSTDTLAAKLINEVGTGCDAPIEDAYRDVKENVEEYYRKTCGVWMAQFCSTYFSSPWTIMALFAATAVLVLRAIRAWYAMKPKCERDTGLLQRGKHKPTLEMFNSF